jgi:hypothetical protein
MESVELATRARRAYELGRLRWAMRIGWVVLGLLVLSFAVAGRSPITAATGVVLWATATVLRWRGRTLGAAVRAGLTAGLIPFGLLIVLKSTAGLFCAFGGCLPHCTGFCGVGGLLAGLLLSARARHVEDRPALFLLAASAVAALTGLLGCFVGGLVGVAWMMVGELGATVPAWALQLRRR